MQCALCGATGQVLYGNLHDRLYQAPGTWDLLACSTCKFVWISPPQSLEQLPELYKGYYTHQHQSPQSTWITQVRRAVLTHPISIAAVRLMTRTGKLNPAVLPSIWKQLWPAQGSQMRMLDIGCGNGTFLQAMASFGWETFGVEPDPSSAQIAQEYFGSRIYNMTVEQAHFGDGEFDLITMNHVIEHLPDPLTTLEECYRILRPGGRLVVFTPNIESLGHQVFRSAWLHLDPPRHLFLFSVDTLRVAVKRANFIPTTLGTVSSGAAFAWCASRLIQQRHDLPRGWRANVPPSVVRAGAVFSLVEKTLSSFRNVGEELALIAVKE